MVKANQVLAAAAGLAVAFVAVAAVGILTPDPGLGSGRATERVARFQFEGGDAAFVEGTTVRLDNRDDVAHVFEVKAPDGSVARVDLAAQGSVNLTLDEQGVYRLSSLLYPWMEADWTVRTSNPVARYFEDLF